MKATVIFEKNWDAVNNEDVRYIVNIGSSRSSKTYSIIQLFYLYACQRPNTKLSVFRDTKKICKDTILEDMKKIYPFLPNYNNVVFNITESIFKFSNGSSIHIEGTDDAVKMHGYHTDVLWFNESYNISKDTFDQLDMRCSGKVIIDLNPRQGHWSDDLSKSNRSISIHSTFKDNPFCPPEQRAKILSYQPIKMSSVVLEGKIKEHDARVYDIQINKLQFTNRELNELQRCIHNEERNTANEFNWQVYGLGTKAERPNRVFHWGEIPLSKYNELQVKKYYGVDWGKVDPFGIVEAKYYDGALYLNEINYESEDKIKDKLNLSERNQISDIPEGFVMWFFNKLGISKTDYVACDTNRPEKIRALRDAGFDYAFGAYKGAGSIVDGVDGLSSIKVYYTSNSINLKYEQENYSRAVDRYGKVIDGEFEDLNNHLIDPTRYIYQFLRREGIIKNV